MWSSRLFWRLFAPLAALNLLVLGIAVALTASRLAAWQQSAAQQRLRDAAVLLRQTWINDPQWPGAGAELRGLEEKLAARLTLVSPTGRILADSATVASSSADAAPAAASRDVGAEPEIAAALETGEGTARRTDPESGAEMLYQAMRVQRGDETIGVVRVGTPTTALDAAVAGFRTRLWTTAAIVGAGIVLLTYLVLRRICLPVATLTAAAEAIADGDYQRYVSLPHRDELGKLAGVFNRMSRQLCTREAELRESRERLAAVLGGMSEGVIAVDDDERIVFANATAGKMLGFSADQVEGRSFLESVRNHKLYRAIEEARATNASRQLEIKIGIRDPRVLNVSLTLLGGDTAPRVILSLHDVTNLRRLETLRRDFVANVSHELKTPLSSIKAYAETLSAGALHDHANNLRFVQQIEEQAERLNDLIMDLMSLAQIESGQKTYNIAPLSVAETVHSCLADYRLAAQAKGVRLVANASSEDIVVAADESALFQILDNLVDNAVKYTPTGGTVTVGWRALESQREGEIEVEDNGIGIAEEHVARLYERFFRVDKARSRELGGTGLGLAIVKHLVQALGGSVHVESRLAQGTRFTIRLPLV